MGVETLERATHDAIMQAPRSEYIDTPSSGWMVHDRYLADWPTEPEHPFEFLFLLNFL